MDWISIVFWMAGTLVVVLGPIVLIHELGHFALAKLAGVRVEEFGFGFPPRLAKLWRGKGYLEIDGAQVIIPAGFRLPGGLHVGALVEASARRQADNRLVLRQLAVLDSDADQGTPPAQVVEEGEKLQGEVTDLEKGTLYSFNWLPIGAFVKMTGEEDPQDPRSLAAQPKRWRLAVLSAGAALNVIAAVLLLVGAYASGYPERYVVEITHVEPGTAAEEIGLLPGDLVLATDGKRISGESLDAGMIQLQAVLRASAEQTVELTLLREGEVLTQEATPRRCGPGLVEEGICDDEHHGILGIGMSPWPDPAEVRRYPLPEAFQATVEEFRSLITMVLALPSRLRQGDTTIAEARPVSVIGASEILAFSLQQSITWGVAFHALQTASLVSLTLGLSNLLPIPAFDGGRILFVLVEAVRRRRISPEREAAIHAVGLMIMISLMLAAMLMDVLYPVISWTWLSR